MKRPGVAAALLSAAALASWAAAALRAGPDREARSSSPEPTPSATAEHKETIVAPPSSAAGAARAALPLHSRPSAPAPEAGPRAAAPASGRQAEPDLHPLRLQLVDRRTLEPVPWCSVRLHQPPREGDPCLSDGEGWIETSAVFAPGELHLELLGPDAASGAPAVDLVAVPADAGLSTAAGRAEVDVGPTYRIAFESPPPVSLADLGAHLRFDGGGASAATVVRDEGAIPWVRFPALPPEDPAAAAAPLAGAATLVVQTADRAWQASAVVGSTVGRAGPVVLLSCNGVASVEGRVEDRLGAPVQTSLFLTRVDDAGYSAATRSALAGAEGEFAFEDLRAGDYALECTDARFQPWSQSLVLAGGERQRAAVTLDYATEGEVRGKLRSRTGTYALPLTLALERGDGVCPYAIEVREWIDEGGALVAPFAFEHVLADEYRLRLNAGGGFPWDPPEIRVRAPDSGIVLVCLDDVQVRAIGFSVRDATSALPIAHFGVEGRARTDGGAVQLARTRSFPAEAPWMRLGPGTRLGWSLRADGYRPAYGTESDFHGPQEPHATWLADVRLQRGWGIEVEVLGRDGDSAVPIEDARVLLDGHLAATTDAQGLARVEADSPPSRVEVRHGAWRSVGPAADGDALDLRDAITRTTVWLAPRD